MTKKNNFKVETETGRIDKYLTEQLESFRAQKYKI